MLRRPGAVVQHSEDQQRCDGELRENEPARVPTEFNARRGIAVVGQREAHYLAHDGSRFPDSQAVLDGAFGGAIGEEQREGERPEPAGFARHAPANARKAQRVSRIPSASNPSAITATPQITSKTNERAARSARSGAARWRSKRATARRLAFHAKSKLSPRSGTAPTAASSATLPAIRSSVARDAPRRIASTRIHRARIAPPSPGWGPRSRWWS